MSERQDTQIDRNIAQAFELLVQRGWVARRTKPGNRGILSSSPGRDWRGVLVDFSFGKLTVHCSGRAAKSYVAEVEALRKLPACLADDLELLSNRHRLEEEAQELLFEQPGREGAQR